MPMVKERMKTLREAPELLAFLFTDDITLNEKAQGLVAKAPEGYLPRVADALETVEPWEASRSRPRSMRSPKPKGSAAPRRSSRFVRRSTGSNVSPPLPESLALLGKERTHYPPPFGGHRVVPLLTPMP